MVPGSTFRYGSHFWQATFSPRLSSRHPIEAAAMPFPREETTPPVSKMYLAILFYPLRHRGVEQLANSREVLGRIHSPGFELGLHHADSIAVFEGAQLLEPLRPFQRPHRQRGISQQEIPPVHVKTDVLEMRSGPGLVALVRNGTPRKVNGVAVAAGHHFDHVGVGNFAVSHSV